ncbi:MAG: hypothetical protein HY706_21015, partial [Candidatus Hydrogenedentes bacterium]|nr:hypothetical protein [Candidatus Hydrogenedentota bacterium]
FIYPLGVAVDSAGNVYVADSGEEFAFGTDNYTIRKVTATRVVTTLAGLAGRVGSVDGTGIAARFIYPLGVAVDSPGNVYLADTGNRTKRKVTPAGAVTTLAGLVGSYGSEDGTGSAARFSCASGVAVDSAGNVYVADTDNNTIRKGNPALIILKSGFDGPKFVLDLTGPVGRLVVVEASTDLVIWLPIWTNTFAGVLSFSDPESGVSSKRFYRAISPVPSKSH